MNNSPTDRRLPLGLFSSELSPRLHDSVAGVLHTRHHRRRTEQACIHCIRRITRFHGSNHARNLTGDDVDRFLSQLAIQEDVAASTQNQALAAALFRYEQVLEKALDRIDGVGRARKPKRFPARPNTRRGSGRLQAIGRFCTPGLHPAIRFRG
jgi:hypothetical protein